VNEKRKKTDPRERYGVLSSFSQPERNREGKTKKLYKDLGDSGQKTWNSNTK
jgi:hypothetical protein